MWHHARAGLAYWRFISLTAAANPAATNTPSRVAKNQVEFILRWREMVGWGLVAARSVCGIAAAAIKSDAQRARAARVSRERVPWTFLRLVFGGRKERRK